MKTSTAVNSNRLIHSQTYHIEIHQGGGMRVRGDIWRSPVVYPDSIFLRRAIIVSLSTAFQGSFTSEFEVVTAFYFEHLITPGTDLDGLYS